MTLANGRKILMLPGPTTVPDEVLQAMHRPAIDIREGELVEMIVYKDRLPQLVRACILESIR